MGELFLRGIYDLGLARRTGVARVGGEALHVVDGAVSASSARSTLSAWRDRGVEDVSFEAGPASRVGVAVQLVAWVRSATSASISALDVLAIERSYARTGIAHGRVRRADLAASDVAILDALATARDLREAAQLARAPRHAVASFVSFLRVAGAMSASSNPAAARPSWRSPVEDPRGRALVSLGLDRDAPSSSVRATFRRLARALHPDMHPHAEESERRALARRFAEVRAAYQVLTVDV